MAQQFLPQQSNQNKEPAEVLRLLIQIQSFSLVQTCFRAQWDYLNTEQLHKIVLLHQEGFLLRESKKYFLLLYS